MTAALPYIKEEEKEKHRCTVTIDGAQCGKLFKAAIFVQKHTSTSIVLLSRVCGGDVGRGEVFNSYVAIRVVPRPSSGWVSRTARWWRRATCATVGRKRRRQRRHVQQRRQDGDDQVWQCECHRFARRGAPATAVERRWECASVASWRQKRRRWGHRFKLDPLPPAPSRSTRERNVLRRRAIRISTGLLRGMWIWLTRVLTHFPPFTRSQNFKVHTHTTDELEACSRDSRCLLAMR